jgi:hypothetical protein
MEGLHELYLSVDLATPTYIENLCKMTQEEILERRSPQIEWTAFEGINLILDTKKNTSAPSA